ncbi:beta-lactamase-like protein [Aspergillus pseudotamarii]|uniref:Beta-lactamase-like protein n=1 Tax=Aspergillus pseudotamarii TaxID=132259 RepID=A0A5N6SS65_ASPPS|nr:beta-lactamase-like protein [Aspergillus pseudotamarii]KAE8136689.1 beta-lactamase-like protein [Aspergillus pseudotamarii]
MSNSLDLAICSTCGTQYPTTCESSCKICDDPRQFIPATGQSWTTLRTLQNTKTYHNEFTPDSIHKDLISIHTVPRVAIGQRALLCRTPTGNLLWDCITYIDDETVSKINELGGLKGIVISHPHFYTTHLHWAEIFDCPVYLAREDREWVVRTGKRQVLWDSSRLPVPGVDADLVAVKTGGHFPGSSVLWWRSLRVLLVADSIGVVPSGIYHVGRLPGTVSFTFMWSYPNMIPLPPDEVHNIWKAVEDLDFDDIRGGFMGTEVNGNCRQRVLESAKIFVKSMGHLEHTIHEEQCL